MRRAEAAAPACDLGALGGARGRHRRLTAALLGAALATADTRRGWRLELPAEPRWGRAAAAWIGLERRCCPFVGFELRWTRGGRLFLDAVAAPAGREALRAGLRAALGG